MSELVTYTQAQRLKKLGFDKQTAHYYDSDGFLNESYKADTEDCVYVSDLSYDFNRSIVSYIGKAISAPTVSEALDFIREKGVMLAVELESKRSRLGEIIGYEYGGAYINDKGKDIWLPTHPTHPLAESALLDAVLTYLEEYFFQ